MAKTLRIRTRTGWTTKPVADEPENRLLAEEVDDNFLALEDRTESRIYVTAAHTASSNERIYADTTAGSFSITLPGSPSDYDSVVILDAGGTFAFNNLTVARNGNTIQDEAADAVLSNSYRELYFIYYNSTWNVFVQPNYRWLTPNQFVLGGPNTANEGDEIFVFIGPFDTGATYTVQVSGGSFTRTSDQITWTIPTVLNDETHFIKVEESTVGGDVVVVKEVDVFNIPTLADDSISVTDFSVNDSNTGWTI